MLRQSYLVVGRSTNSGKTTVATALIRAARQAGIACCGFKPSGGTILWEDPDFVLGILQAGRVYGGDCVALKAASQSELPEELFGPDYHVIGHLSGWPAESPLGPSVVERFAVLEGREVRSVFVINEPLMDHLGFGELLAPILRQGSVHRISSREQYRPLYEEYAARSIRTAHERLAEVHEVMVFESRSAAASPWLDFVNGQFVNGIRQLDRVIYVEPYRVTLFDGREYLEAVDATIRETKLASRTQVFATITADAAVKRLKPVRDFKFPPLRSTELGRLEAILDAEIVKAMRA